MSYHSNHTVLDQSEELPTNDTDFKNGIWPRSIPLWMTSFYMALFIIRPWEQLLPLLGDIHFEKIYTILMLLAVVFSNKKKIRFTFQSFTVLLLLAAIGISAMFAWKPSLSSDPFVDYRNIVIIFFVLLFVIRSPQELVFIIISYIFIMTIYLGKAQWEFFVHGAHRYDMGVVRMVGIEDTYGGPNDLAMSIDVTLPFLFFLWIKRKEISRSWPALYKKWYPRFLFVYLALCLTSVILTNSRSGMLGFVLFIVLITFKGRGFFKKIAYVLLGGLVLLVVWQFTPEENKNRFRTIWDKDAGPSNAQVSAEGRIQGLKAGMAMFKRYPITGIGIGNFIAYRITYLDGIPLQAHNLIGQVLGETGIVGALAFIIMLITILINSHRAKGLVKGESDDILLLNRDLCTAVEYALIILLFLGFFGHNLDRYNWLWYAAFANLALLFNRDRLRDLERANTE